MGDTGADSRHLHSFLRRMSVLTTRIYHLRIVLALLLIVLLYSSPGISQRRTINQTLNSYTVVIDSGWNLLSLPFSPDDLDKSFLYPNAISGAYTYRNGCIISRIPDQ